MWDRQRGRARRSLNAKLHPKTLNCMQKPMLADTLAPNENVERAKQDLRAVVRLEPTNAQAQAALHRLVPKFLTPQEEAEKAAKAAEIDRLKALRVAQEASKEKERRKAQRNGKKIAIRELPVEGEGGEVEREWESTDDEFNHADKDVMGPDRMTPPTPDTPRYG